MPQIETICASCKTQQEVTLSTPPFPKCNHCQAKLLKEFTPNFTKSFLLDQCPICACAHVYRQKDFNKSLGLALVVLGILLAYYTYGISILAVTLLDFFIYKQVPEIACCYKCHSIFRDFPKITEVPTFSLQLYDYYRNLKV